MPMASSLLLSDLLNPDQELDITGYSVRHVLDLLQTHDQDFRRARGDAKVTNVSGWKVENFFRV